jgi:hypothetical protein
MSFLTPFLPPEEGRSKGTLGEVKGDIGEVKGDIGGGQRGHCIIPAEAERLAKPASIEKSSVPSLRGRKGDIAQS